MTNPGSTRARRWRAACLWLLLVLSMPLQAQQGRVEAELGSDTITIEETVRLAITATDVEGELDTSALASDFDVVGRSSSRNVEIRNGKRRLFVSWMLELRPRTPGILTVPGVGVKGIYSQPLTLTVREAPTGAARDIYIEAAVDDTSPWVQSQVVLTLRVFRAIEIVDGALSDPQGEGLEIMGLGEGRQYSETRDGRNYLVDERRFAVFPQRSGALSIEPVAVSVKVPADPSRVRGFFSPTRSLERRSDAIRLAVQARPSGARGWWLPATDVTLREEPDLAAGSNDEIRVGEPLTRTIRLRASGVLDTLLPDIDVPEIDGLGIYADDPQRDIEASGNGIAATQLLSLAIIPERPGTFELPPVVVDWFDVNRDEVRTAELPARTITVLPGQGGNAANSTALRRDADNRIDSAGSEDAAAVADRSALSAESTVPTNADDDSGDTALVASGTSIEVQQEGKLLEARNRWRWMAAAAVLAWLLTLVAWLCERHRARRVTSSASTVSNKGLPNEQSLAEAHRSLQRAINANDVDAVSQALLGIGAAVESNAPPRNLHVLADALEADEPLRERLQAIDASLYRQADSEARTSTLFDGLASMVMGAARKQTAANRSESRHATFPGARRRRQATDSGEDELPQL